MKVYTFEYFNREVKKSMTVSSYVLFLMKNNSCNALVSFLCIFIYWSIFHFALL